MGQPTVISAIGRASLVAIFAILVISCGKNNKPDEPPQSTQKDMDVNDMSSDQTTMDMTPDSSNDMTKDETKDQTTNDDMKASLPQTCANTCAQTTASATFGNKSATFQNVRFGLLAASRTSSKTIEMQLEAFNGGTSGCPEMNSPTPQQTLIVSGLSGSISTSTPITEKDGVVIKLIDYDGSLLDDELFVDATSFTLTPVAANICTTCLSTQEPDTDSFLTFDAQINFDGGQITGRFYGQHCDSMDAK